MSNHEGPSRRRRIAGESRPSDARVPTGAKKVVKKPVARPGAPADPKEPVEETAPEVVDPQQPDTEAPDTGTPDADTSDTEPAPAPRVAPRVGRRSERSRVEPDPVAAPPAADAAEQADDEPTDGAAPTAAGSGRRRPPAGRVALVAIAVAALAFGAVFGFRGFTDWRETRGVEGAHAQAAEAAATAAETVFTYRYDQLEQYLEDSKDVMTPSFASDFETISPALNDLAPQREIVVQATTRDSAPLPCGDDCRRDRATVLLFVDQARLADGSEVPTVFGNRVEMTMVERDGRWLVDDIKAL